MEKLKCPLSRQDLKKAEQYGGSDWQYWSEYNNRNGDLYCNKGGHLKRSQFNQPNHLKHRKN